ncbi:MAG: glycosyltransferase family 4 protein [Candidatus Curtissbacteria bacterium]
MKVALIIDTWFPTIGGGQTNALEISKRLAKKGINIDIITRSTGADDAKLPPNIKVVRLGPKAKPFDYLSKIAFLPRAYIYVAKGNYDLVHAHAFLPGIIAWLLKLQKGLPTVFTVHGTSRGTGLNNPLKSFFEELILTKLSYNAQISVSQDFLKLKNVNKKIYYVPNGVDVKNFDNVSSMKPKYQTVLFVGRLHPQKNLINLIKAISLVKKDISDIRLILVGAGPQKKTLRNLAHQLNLDKNIVFEGQIVGTALIRLYKSSDLFVLPSIYEGQPLTVLEAWASKLPVVVSATGDLPYIVKDGENGYLIEHPEDVEEIASQIKKALGSKNLRNMGQNGYNLTVRDFSWEKSAQETLKIYNNLLNGSLFGKS